MLKFCGRVKLWYGSRVERTGAQLNKSENGTKVQCNGIKGGLPLKGETVMARVPLVHDRRRPIVRQTTS